MLFPFFFFFLTSESDSEAVCVRRRRDTVMWADRRAAFCSSEPVAMSIVREVTSECLVSTAGPPRRRRLLSSFFQRSNGSRWRRSHGSGQTERDKEVDGQTGRRAGRRVINKSPQSSETRGRHTAGHCFSR